VDKPLAGTTVVVTRPVHQAEPLCQLIESCGGTALRFPTLDIGEPSNQHVLRRIVKNLDQYDIAIFVSPNAVEWGMKFIQDSGGLPTTLKIAAVGQGTTRKLASFGISVDIFPGEQFNSESLLATEELQQIAGKRIVILRGEGGRELLAEQLRQRGASVEYAECYRRLRPDADSSMLSAKLADGSIDIITVTSNEALQNLCAMVDESDLVRLRKLPLIVVSDRARQLALELGFSVPVIISGKVSDDALLDAIIHWKSGRANPKAVG